MKLQAVGYKALMQKYNIQTIDNWHYSFVSVNDYTQKVEKFSNYIHEIYPKKYAIKNSDMHNLEFALKYDGVNLLLLTKIFEKIDTDEFIEYINAKPTGKYVRKLWYLYEFLMDKKLPINDLKQGNYIDLLESKKYYTQPSPKSIKRQRVRDNLLGNSNFCPIVRKTQKLKEYEELNIPNKISKVLKEYPELILRRALSYLYTKETKSSFEIERVKLSSQRVEKFVSLLKDANRDDFCTKERLIELQNRIVDDRFADSSYRTTQNYVGESISYGKERVHYISPKPEDLPNLMSGLIDTHNKLSNIKELAIIHATIISYGFVYLHPFEDGNGRIHRFLLHNILAREDFTPKEIIFPISAVMLKNPTLYDDSLEAFSKHLLEFIDYILDEDGKLNVLNDTKDYYRFIDMTKQVELLFELILKTIDEELKQELSYILAYDTIKKAILNIVDMPNRQIDLFIRFVTQNGGKLSEVKRKKYFDFLTKEEIIAMEKSVNFKN